MADQSSTEMTMQDREYRHFYRDARNRELLAMQIRAMRDKEGWTQEQLGTLAGMKQERISVLEDADNGSITYKTLARLADAFDVDLIVRFAPYSETEEWVKRMGAVQLAVPSFDEDLGLALTTSEDADSTVDEKLEVTGHFYARGDALKGSDGIILKFADYTRAGPGYWPGDRQILQVSENTGTEDVGTRSALLRVSR